MASGGKHPDGDSPLGKFFNNFLGGKAKSQDQFHDAEDLSELKLPAGRPANLPKTPFGAEIKIPHGTLDPRVKQGSNVNLKTAETDKTNPKLSTETKDVGSVPKPKQALTRPVVEAEVEAEEPLLREELSDEEDTEDFDLDLLDPEEEGAEEITTLAAIFPKVSLKPDDLAKDPEPDPDRIMDTLGNNDPDEVERFLDYYKGLCRHRRKIYQHARLLLRKLMNKDYSANDVEDLLFYAENSKRTLEFIHAKLIDMYDASAGQKRSYTCGMRNFVQAIDLLKTNLDLNKDAKQELQRKAIKKAEADRAKAEAEKAKAEADRAKAEDEKEKALSQIQALKLAREAGKQTVLPAKVKPPNMDSTRPTGFGAGHSDDRSETGTNFRPPGDDTTPRRNQSHFRFGNWSRGGRGGRGGSGGRPPDRGDQPPFRPSQEDEENPFSVFAREIVNALRTTPQDSTKPDYRGIEKPKLDTFSGDASVYAHWKRRFHTLYSPERNLSDSYLANTLYALLKGEARAQVEAHFTTDWNGDSYHRMWEQLDLDYGSEHIQDRCIQDRAARIAPLDQESLKTVGKFYLELTVQINYYQLSQPEVLTRSNNHLYQLMRHKINDDLLIKFIEWCRLHASDELPPRSLIALQAWLLERLEVLREAETFSNSARQRSSKSPSRSSYTGTIEPEVEDESDSDTDPTHSVLLTHSDGKKVMFNKQKNKHFRYKPAFGEKRTPGTFIKSGNQAAYRQSFDATDTLCPVCRDVSHELSTCPKFKKLITYKRYAIVRQCRACFHCLNRGHAMSDCDINKGVQCGVDGCKRYENPLIHADDTTRGIAYSDWNTVTHGELVWNDNDGDDIPTRSGFHTVMRLARDGAIGIQTFVSRLFGRSRRNEMKIVVMLDSGADVSYVDEQTAIDLQLRKLSAPETAFIKQFDGKTKIQTHLVEVNLSSIDGLVTQTITAWTKKDLTKTTGVVDWSKHKHNFAHIKHIPFETLPADARVRLLIGTKEAFLFAQEEGTQHKGAQGEPTAYMCALGWTCYGPSEYIDPKIARKLDPLMDSQIPRNK